LGTPLLLLFPGMAIMLVRSSEATAENSDQFEKTVNSGRDYKRLQKWLLLGSALLIIIMIIMLAYRKPILARWYANLGAVEMSRTELNGWPLNKWNSNPDVSPIEPAEAMFSRAVGLNSQQRTSLHRLGLISLQSRDFASAREKLEKAHYIDPEHRGIRKALGYTYVWVGELKKAQELLRLLKETEYEMGFFSQWWRRLDRQDLALRAEEMEIILRDQNRFIQDQGENNQ
jgi:tetratricopeptide (TPR) repeat protein